MVDEPWTVRRMLTWMRDDFQARGLDAPRLDAEVLLAHALSLPRMQLYLDMERPLSADELARVRALVQRRRKHEPVAYILGQREFYSRVFAVDARVLIPRPDTETLVDHALARFPAGRPGRALDLCTGSGCIGITLAAERPALQVDVTDLSQDALALARHNAELLGTVARMRFWHGDLWACVGERDYDLIVANPPYVSETEYAELMADVHAHEPRMALVAEDRGLSFYRRLAARAREFLAPDGHLLLEVGAGQAGQVEALLSPSFDHVESVQDLGGVMRVVIASSTTPARPEGERWVEPIVEPSPPAPSGAEEPDRADE